MTRRGKRLGLAAAAVVAWLTAVPAVLADEAAVGMYDLSFAPDELVITAGDSVTFTNGDRVNHTASGSGWGSGTLAGGATATVTFASPGTYPYTCRFHPAMAGTIVVEAATGASGGDGDPDPPATDASAPADDRGDGAGPGLLVALAGLLGAAAWSGPVRRAARRRAAAAANL